MNLQIDQDKKNVNIKIFKQIIRKVYCKADLNFQIDSLMVHETINVYKKTQKINC